MNELYSAIQYSPYLEKSAFHTILLPFTTAGELAQGLHLRHSHPQGPTLVNRCLDMYCKDLYCRLQTYQ